MNDKSLAGMMLVLLLAILVIYPMTYSPVIVSESDGQGIGYTGVVCTKVIRTTGKIEDLGCRKNLLMDEGKEFIEAELGVSASTNIVDRLFLGNGTTWGTSAISVHTDEINDCGLGAVAASGTSIGTGNWSFTNTFTCSCSGGVIVNTTGLNCSACAAGQEFFAGNNFTAVTLQNNDQINVTWYVFVT